MLYADSNKGKVFKHLVEIIALPENIRLAYRNIKKNHGSMTPGTDGKTITELATLSDEQLISSVQHKLDWYVPQSVRRVEIPKGNDPTKKRPLGIPTIMDRLIQQCVLQVMEPICEATGICAKPILRATAPTSTPRLSLANSSMSIAQRLKPPSEVVLTLSFLNLPQTRARQKLSKPKTL